MSSGTFGLKKGVLEECTRKWKFIYTQSLSFPFSPSNFSASLFLFFQTLDFRISQAKFSFVSNWRRQRNVRECSLRKKNFKLMQSSSTISPLTRNIFFHLFFASSPRSKGSELLNPIETFLVNPFFYTHDDFFRNFRKKTISRCLNLFL